MKVLGWASMMVSPKAAQEKGDDFARAPVGTGPFTFLEWIKADHLTVKKTPNYWKQGADGSPLPYLDEVIYRAVPDGSVAVTAAGPARPTCSIFRCPRMSRP